MLEIDDQVLQTWRQRERCVCGPCPGLKMPGQFRRRRESPKRTGTQVVDKPHCGGHSGSLANSYIAFKTRGRSVVGHRFS